MPYLYGLNQMIDIYFNKHNLYLLKCLNINLVLSKDLNGLAFIVLWLINGKVKTYNIY